MTLKVAIASFAHTHAASYAWLLGQMPDVEVLSADPDGAAAPDAGPRGAEFAAELGVPYVDSYDELFAWGPDAVVVTSENAGHRALVERAAAAGAHVLCEKPLATEVADGEAMLAACAAAGSILMIAYPVRFAPSYLRLRAMVEAGRLGDVFAVLGTNNGKIPYDSRQWFTDATLAGGGALVDHTVHCADLIDGLTGGASATRVYAASNRILHQDKDVAVETGGLVTVTYDNGLLATIDCSWSVPDNGPTWGGVSLEVTGTNGSVEIEPFLPHLTGTDANGEVFLGIGPNLDESLLDTFLDAVRTAGPPVAGKPPAVVPQPDGNVGLRTLRIVDAARRSALSGQPVDL
ncbi:Gfo/Idh/MocA family oxidoreductase [Kribbella sandramycini]|uniref:Gfo/Idh/MocA family oxidoreductase n=1 Tax=Kribbella sandramycini TaxID=60450 RepID=A0A7Y4L5L5_9ACTN|nr:Gfo/Idh/MocA family oxidoreductase [Kribbella sandramycini]MBB6570746.1 putative dehydrogenase [Kribbella sandramycini]NOL43887.1 Gfo/Idh/MocA family oxidoreductase [Kribbella sandramycini]